MATEVWKFQDGTEGEDFLNGAAVGPNNTVVLVGTTNGSWDSPNAGGDDMAVIKLDIDGNILWTWQNGTSMNDHAQSVAVAEDGSITVGGYRETETESAFVVVKLNGDGDLLWQWEGGTGSADVGSAIAMWEDGSIVLAGQTEGDWNGTNLGLIDLAAFKLNEDGTLQWKFQDGTNRTEYFTGAAVGEDGSVVLAGSSAGNWDGLKYGPLDFVAIKIDSWGAELWRWQGGTGKSDFAKDVAIGDDGSVFLAGFTFGDWGNVKSGRSDFAVVKLSTDGNELWRWQGGTAETDYLFGILVEDDGSIVLSGSSNGEWDGSGTGSSTDFAVVKLDENGTEVWRWKNGSSNYDDARVVASIGSTSQVIVAGTTLGAWAIDNLGGHDFAAFLLDTGTPASPAPTSTPLQTHEPVVGAPPTLRPTPFVGTTKPPGREATLAPTHEPETLVSRRTSSPTLATDGDPFDMSLMVTVLCGIVACVAVVCAGWLCRRQCRRQDKNETSPAGHDVEEHGDGADSSVFHASPHSSDGMPSRRSHLPVHDEGSPSLHVEPKATVTGNTSMFVKKSYMQHIGEEGSVEPSVQLDDWRQAGGIDGDEGRAESGACSPSVQIPARDGTEPLPVDGGEANTAMPVLNESGTFPIRDCRRKARGVGITEAVIGAAKGLARMSQFPGVAEVAGLVVVLMNLATDSSDIVGASDTMVRRCRSVMGLLQRAERVLEEADSTNEPDHHILIEDVRDAVGDLVEIIRTYKSKGRISQVMMSTLFKRRQEEAEAVIEVALGRLHFGVHMQVLKKCMVGPDLTGDPYLQPGRHKRSELDSSATSMWDARRIRRQRNLDKIEIPEHDVMITDELLGKGGFGAVYMADYNGRNVAVKIVQVEHDLRRPNGVPGEMSSGTKNLGKRNSHEDSRCRLFWKELRAMIRLRSPHTVNVFGAITSRADRLVLVMELLPGGDLHAWLKGAAEPLSEERARQLIGDICAGMYFLHQKETVHGDLKSPNVLLDGDGRAKIADFGTSKWPQLTNSTGLVTTTTTEANRNTQMSYAWASPEVLDTKGSSYASDVYSFGVVVWEVLTRETPWAGVCLRDIYVHMVIKEDRLNIPTESPTRLAIVMNACWARVPEERPTFSKITRWLSWE